MAAVGDLHRDAGFVDEARGLELGDHAADGSLALGAPGELLDFGVDAVHVADQATGAVGVGGETADIGKNDQPFRAGENGDVGGELVVVAEARADEFVVGHDVVLVEDRNDAFVLEKVLHATLDIAVEGAAIEFQISEQDLRDAHAGVIEGFVIKPHQPGLAERSAGLQFRHDGGAFCQAKKRHAAADCAGTDEQHFMALLTQFDHLGGDLFDLGDIDLTSGITENAGAELNHPTLGDRSKFVLAHGMMDRTRR